MLRSGVHSRSSATTDSSLILVVPAVTISGPLQVSPGVISFWACGIECGPILDLSSSVMFWASSLFPPDASAVICGAFHTVGM